MDYQLTHTLIAFIAVVVVLLFCLRCLYWRWKWRRVRESRLTQFYVDDWKDKLEEAKEKQ